MYFRQFSKHRKTFLAQCVALTSNPLNEHLKAHSSRPHSGPKVLIKKVENRTSCTHRNNRLLVGSQWSRHVAKQCIFLLPLAASCGFGSRRHYYTTHYRQTCVPKKSPQLPLNNILYDLEVKSYDFCPFSIRNIHISFVVLLQIVPFRYESICWPNT